MKTKIVHASLAPCWALLLVLALYVVAPPAPAASANPPDYMTYQGFLVDSSGVALGFTAPKNYDVVFRIYNAQNAGDRLWTEQQTVTVDKGYFSVLLGEGSDIGEPRPPLSDLFRATDDVSDRFVEITVKGIGAGSPPADVTIRPRLRLLTSPYAFLARNAVSLVSGPNQVVSTKLGYVGINTADPTAQLDVNGAIRASELNVAGALNVTGTATASNFIGNFTGNFIGNGTIPLGGIIMWSGASVPNGWALCDGQNGTPDLRDRFIVGSGSTYQTGNTGGADTVTLSTSQVPLRSHAHDYFDIFESDEGWYGTWEARPGDTSAQGDGVQHRVVYRNTGAAGSETGIAAHENRPPFYALAFIMRVR